MKYIWQSIFTRSYWKYALFSLDGSKSFFAVLGVVWTIFEMLEYFKKFQQNELPSYTFWVLVIMSIIIVLITRRPITRISYKLPGKDLNIEVRIGDLFKVKGQKVISTNTTFDTDIANGIISANSLQGQFTNIYFPQRVAALDQVLDAELVTLPSVNYVKVSGKTTKYEMGTTVRINLANEVFYFLAMSDLNFNNNAQTTFEDVLKSLDALWTYIISKGENDTVVLPLIGTGRGRITTNRKRLIARIAQSFVHASQNQIFSGKLIIVIHPGDAESFDINLFKVKDLLSNYLP